MLPNRQLLAQIVQLTAILTYAFFFVFLYNGNRISWHWPLILIFAGLLELGVHYYNRKALRFPITGMISGGAAFILLVTRYSIAPYLVTVGAAILSKALFRYNHRHVFNPACIGILVTLCLMPGLASLSTDQGEVDTSFYALLLSFGLLASFLANRLTLSLSYIFGFLVTSYFHGFLILDTPPIFLLGRLISVGSLIFAFHMISDPVTTPKGVKEQIGFGVLIAVIDYTLRLNSLIIAPYLALALVQAARAALPKQHPLPLPN